MIAYCDTSALAALALEEPGAARVRALLENIRRVGCSEIGVVELRAAVARAVLVGRLAESDAARARVRWENVWRRVTVMPVTSAVLLRAAVVAEQHGLRAYDAVHLAAAESLAIEMGKRRVRWVCLDHRLDEAAVAVGLVVG